MAKCIMGDFGFLLLDWSSRCSAWQKDTAQTHHTSPARSNNTNFNQATINCTTTHSKDRNYLLCFCGEPLSKSYSGHRWERVSYVGFWDIVVLVEIETGSVLMGLSNPTLQLNKNDTTAITNCLKFISEFSLGIRFIAIESDWYFIIFTISMHIVIIIIITVILLLLLLLVLILLL